MRDVPVLLIAFNRPDLTQAVLTRLEEVGVRELYVAVDGPRPEKQGEAQLVAAVQALVEGADWGCSVHTLFRADNLGCAKGVSGAISWLFSQVEEGIILEDDILPDPSFFPFVAELLERYRTDDRVAAVSGCNLVPPERIGTEGSYRFARVPHIWGWATWRRVWVDYQLDISDWRTRWPESERRRALGSAAADRHWSRLFDRVGRGEIDTWDYSFTLQCLRAGALTATSNVNLTENLGFRADATHTIATPPAYFRPVQPLVGPVLHPPEVKADKRSDVWTQHRVFGATNGARIKGLARGAVRRAARLWR